MEHKRYMDKLAVAASQNIQEKNYWLTKLSGNLQRTSFLADYKKTNGNAARMDKLQFSFDNDIFEKLNKLSKQKDHTLHLILVAGLVAILRKHTGNNDILLGTPIYKPEVEANFINTVLVLRNQMHMDINFKELLMGVKQTVIEAQKYQNYPIEILVEQLNLQWNEEDFPLFDVAVLLENIHDANHLRHIPLNMLFSFARTNGHIQLELNYNSALYSRASVEFIINRLHSFFNTALANPDREISYIDIMSPQEKRNILEDFNNTRAEYRKNTSIHRLFLEQVERAGDRTAIIDTGHPVGSRRVTYRELNEKSARLAHLLRQKGVGRDIIVAVMMDRSLEMMTGIFAVLKAGGAYLPIDSHYPMDRIAHMLVDSEVKILLSEVKEIDGVRKEIEIIGIREFLQQPFQETSLGDITGDEANAGSQVAYVIYTSGSTGKPKGVMIEHQALVNRLNWMQQSYPLCERDVILQKTSITFDVSVWELFWWSFTGASQALLGPGLEKFPDALIEAIAKNNVTTMHFVPSMLNAFLEYMDVSADRGSQDYRSLLCSLRQVFSSGEALGALQVEKFNRMLRKTNQTKLINLYGPTEATIDVSYFNCPPGEKLDIMTIPIGKPIDNINLFVLDKELRLQPVGIPGELGIAGDGVARGYLNRPELSKEKFVPPTDLPAPAFTCSKIYRTGDLTRWLPDGNIEFLGRLDFQVKIRGNRIELEEIEYRLLEHEGVKETVVVARKDDSGDVYLCAYFVPGGPKSAFDSSIPRGEALKDHLSQTLPSYMVPSFVVELEKIPLTANGKIDRKALPDPGGILYQQDRYIAPANKWEQGLAEIWQSLLDVEKIGVNDNLFNIGGDSIKCIRIISQVNATFNSNFKISDLYAYPTIKKFAAKMSQVHDAGGDDGSEALKEATRRIEELDSKARATYPDKDNLENIEGFYPMSDIEKGMVFHAYSHSEEAIYHDQFVYHPKYASFEPETFKKAMYLLMKKHQILRTSFNVDDFDEFVHIIHKEVPVTYTHFDLNGQNKQEQQAYIENYIKTDRQHSWDIKSPPLWRLATFSLGNDNICIVWTFHHAILDGWSNASMVTELNNTYFKLKTDQNFIPEKLKVSFNEFIMEEIVEKNKKENSNFWLNQLTGFKRTQFPGISKENKTTAFHDLFHSYQDDFHETLKNTAKRYNSNLKHLCFAAYVAMMSMMSYENDVVVGLITNNRPEREDGDKMLGCFLNTMPFRLKIPEQITWETYMTMVHEKLIQLKRYEKMTFYEIVKLLGEKNRSENPIFDSICVYVDFHIYRQAILEQDTGDIDSGVSVIGYERTNTLFDYRVRITPYGILEIGFIYSTSIIGDETVKKLFSYLENVLDLIVNRPGDLMRRDEIISKEEKQKLLFEFNNTEAGYPKEKKLHRLFEEQVTRTPDKVALVGTGSGEIISLSFRKLNEKTNQLARLLRENSVTADTIIGIMLQRSVEMIIGIMGILKSGGAYLPIDPQYPDKRITYLLQDSNTNIILTQLKFVDKIKSGVNIIDLENQGLYTGGTGNLPPINNSSNLAYIIYTSGTTGNPKGSMIEHASIVNRLNWMQKGYPLDEKDTILQKTPFTFDVSLWELFWWSIVGANVFLLEAGGEKDPGKIAGAIATHGITVMHFVPAMLNAFLEHIEESVDLEGLVSLRQVFASGEALLPQHVNMFSRLLYNRHGTHLTNLYGPTEATVDVSYFDCTTGEPIERVPIGKPIDNIQLYILSQNLQLQPLEVAGELCIGGVGLARGYLNRPEMTQTKFEYIYLLENLLKRVYRTGDLARWLLDGNIEFLGRIDHQVKVRGFRIELDEIESQLLNHDDVKDVVVMARDDQHGNKYLCAYIVSDTEAQVSTLKNYLTDNLPDYMIPSFFIPLDKIPLTTNGKVDRSKLPDPRTLDLGSDTEYVAPSNPVEKKLAEIWEHVLDREKVSLKDNFFEIGGDSIKIIQIVSRMRKAGYLLETRDILRNPRISLLAPLVKELDRTSEQSTITGPVPLTPIQKWFFEKCGDKHHFNEAVILHPDPGVRFDKDTVNALLKKLIAHHDALRMTYREENGEIIQFNHDQDYPLSLEIYDLRSVKKADEAIEARLDEIKNSFHLETGPLMKSALFQLKDNDCLLIVIHHLVIDRISWQIVIRDLDTLFQQSQRGEDLVLPRKTDSFKLWAEKLSEYAGSQSILAERKYWEELATKSIPVIPGDFEHTPKDTKKIGTLSVNLNETQTRLLLTNVNDAFGTGTIDILLTALGLAVKKAYGNDRLLIALEGNGREETVTDVNVSRTVGWFNCLYPILLDFSHESGYDGEKGLGRQIKEVKEHLRRVPHQGVGYGILKYLAPENRKPGPDFRLKPQIRFKYPGQLDDHLEGISFGVAQEAVGSTHSLNGQSEYDINISGIITGKQLNIALFYDKQQYKQVTLKNLLSHFKKSLVQIISFCSGKDEKELTPSDFTYSTLTIDTVEQLQEQYGYLIEDIYTLSPMQEGMLFHSLYEKNTSAYFEQVSYRLHGPLDRNLIEKSFNQLSRRYEILRTAFVHEDLERPLQIVLKNRKIDFYFEDFTEKTERSTVETYIKEFKETDKNRSFDLSRDPLMRVAILRIAKEEYEFIWSHHHIIMDGWCIRIINAELLEIYNHFLENRPAQLPEIKPYRLYIGWLEQQEKEASKRYWTEYTESYEESVGIPRQNILKSTEAAYNSKLLSFVMNPENTNGLNKLAAQQKVTLNTIIQAAWGIVLGKYNSKEDVIFGAVVSGRPSAIDGVETMVGLFINTIPVRIRYEEGTAFDELLQQVLKAAIESEPHHYYPLAEIQSNSTLKQNLLDHILLFQNYPIVDKLYGMMEGRTEPDKELQLELSSVEVFEQTNYDLNLIIVPGEELALKFNYNANVYEEDFIGILANHVSQVLIQVLANPQQKVEKLSMLSGEEKKQILYRFNDPEAEYPVNKTVHELFSEQAERTPDSIAVVGMSLGFQEKESPAGTGKPAQSSEFISITYRELSNKSAYLARLLQAKHVNPDTIVGIMMERSVEMIISILGIVKTGGAYLPIDPEYPPERINYMLTDSNARIMLTLPGMQDKVNAVVEEESTGLFKVNEAMKGTGEPIVLTLTSTSTPTLASVSASGQTACADHLAYIIYTSGSTGKPKGVMIQHGSLVNTLFCLLTEYQFSATDVYLFKTSHVFDVSVSEIFGWFWQGGRLAILEKDAEKDPARILEQIQRHNVTHINFVPSMFSAFLDNLDNQNISKLSTLKYILLAGEELPPAMVRGFKKFAIGTELENIYGPTEATIYASKYSLRGWGKTDAGGTAPLTYYHGRDIQNPEEEAREESKNSELGSIERIPIGKPLQNMTMYILDKYNGLQPVGISGELCIGGLGLARGYLNKPELTREKFFQESSISPVAVIYKTGDLARWLADGNIEFLGRIDHQVKIRGFRVELGEIESHLLNHNDIKEAIVLEKEDESGNKYLCAYFISDKEFTITQLRSFLSGSLPDYMLPSYFIPLEKIPLTSSGKVDRNSLPQPGAINLGSDTAYIGPRNIVEKRLTETWQQVLGVNVVGINDNFFEIGGDSIKTIQIVSRMKRYGYKLEMSHIFRNPRISDLAPFVKKIERTPDQSAITGPIPLTPVQKYLLENHPAGNNHLNQAVLLDIQQEIEADTLNIVFQKLQEHHDALRIIYRQSDREIIQLNQGPEHPVSCRVYDYRKQKKAVELMAGKVSEIRASLDLETGPLMKTALFYLDDGNRLLIVLPSLVTDSVSWQILLEDMETLYRLHKSGQSLTLPQKTDSFKLWSEKLSLYGNSSQLADQNAYWQDLESQQVPSLIPGSTAKPGRQEKAETISFSLEEKETRLLSSTVNDAFGTTSADILLTALGAAISRVFGNHRFLIALENSTREKLWEDIDISRTLGCFTRIYPALLDFSHHPGNIDGNDSTSENEDDKNLGRQIKEIKETLRRVPDKGLGYGIRQQDTRFALQPQVLFNFMGQLDSNLQSGTFNIAPETAQYIRSLNQPGVFALDVSGIIINQGLTISIASVSRKIKRETLEILSNSFKKELLHIIAYCSSRPVKQLTPSDLTYKELSIDIFDRLQQKHSYLIEDIYPLSPMQEGMLFYTLYENNNKLLYFKQMPYLIQGEVNLSHLQKSLKELFNRHSILRTVFVHEGLNRPLQMVLKERNPDFYFQDLSREKLSREDKMMVVGDFLKKDQQRAFDLGEDVLMRMTVFKTEANEYHITWSVHHILIDGWCLRTLVSDFLEIYTSSIENRCYELTPVKPYRDYIRWLEKQDKNKTKNYWKKYLAGYEEIASVPRKKKKEIFTGGYRAESSFIRFEQNKTSALHKVASRNHVTLNTLIHAMWGVLLGKYTSRQDIVFGAVVSGRPPEVEGVESMVGCFINTIPVRIAYDQDTRFQELLKNAQGRAIESDPHHYFSLAEIQAECPLKQNLLDHIILFQNIPEKERKPGPWHNVETNEEIVPVETRNTEDLEKENPGKEESEDMSAFEHGGDYNFYINVVPREQLDIIFTYNANLFDPELVEQLGLKSILILEQIIENDGLTIGEINISSENEKRKILFEFNNNSADFPREKTVFQFVENHAEKTAHRLALTSTLNLNTALNSQLTYRELNKRTSKLATILRSDGIQTDEPVGILMDRSQAMVESILAVWKAGGAYLPLDPDSPADRLEYMLLNSKTKVLMIAGENNNLTEEVGNLKNWKGKLLNASTFAPPTQTDISSVSSPLSSNRFNTANLAYIIYTSGSTGQPKGAMIEHIGMMNHLQAKIDQLQLTPASIIVQNARQTFDISVWQFFAALTTGGKTIIFHEELIMEPEQFLLRVVNHKVTVLEVVPSYLSVLLDYTASQGTLPLTLEYLLVTGEEVKPHLVKKWFDLYPGIKMVNAYGPTEASDDITHFIMDNAPDMDRIPIGKPLQNLNIYIVDQRMQICPIGVRGEICVSGVGVGRGYIGDEQKTKQAFMEDPFREEKGVRLYKTGDLGAWLPDGNIEFFGRKDYQVKIRGFRIELGEIENQLLKHPGIKEAVVIDREDNVGNKYLCAYMTTQSSPSPEAAQLKEYLSGNLPDYMIPAYFMEMDRIPLNPSGKIDRKRLPSPDEKEIMQEIYTAPTNPLEEKLVDIWSGVLEKDKTSIGIDHSFFDLGGHSLKAIVLISKMREAFNTAVPLYELFKTPTIRALATYINRLMNNNAGNAETIESIAANDDNLVLLKPGINSANHLFLVHDGTGEVEGYIEFSKLIPDRFHCWGLRAQRLENLAPQHWSIEFLAKNYIEKIKKVQARGPYYIAGWSLGGIIAFEMANQLEQVNEEIKFFAMIDSAPPLAKQIKKKKQTLEFHLESELKILRSYAVNSELEEKLKQVTHINQFWLLVVEYLETRKYDTEAIKKAITTYGMQALPHFQYLDIRDSIYYQNVGRTFHHASTSYIPSGKLNTTIHLFKASQSRYKHQPWNNYCQQPLKLHTLEGDHFSIFQLPWVNSLAHTFNRMIENP